MKRMLINATQEEELRMAMVDGQNLYDLNIELPAGERKKANIYKGKITRIEPSLEAAFVDFGGDRHGFLPLKEISSEYFVKQVESGKPNIKDVLNEGQDIVVQIDKEERGTKGAALTTFVSLAGRFVVLKPNKSNSGGVSRRIVGADRDLARSSLNDVEVPKGMSVILRTAGIDRSPEELAWDLENLLTIWHALLNIVLERKSPFLIYRESNSVVRALRDYFTNDIGEILIDDETTYKEALEFVEQVMPHNVKKLKHYVDPVPLFTRYQIESQFPFRRLNTAVGLSARLGPQHQGHVRPDRPRFNLLDALLNHADALVYLLDAHPKTVVVVAASGHRDVELHPVVGIVGVHLAPVPGQPAGP